MRRDEQDGLPIFGESEYTHSGTFGGMYPPTICANPTCRGMYRYFDCTAKIEGLWVDGHCWRCPKCGSIWFQDEYTREKYKEKIKIIGCK